MNHYPWRISRAYLGILADIWEMSELDLLQWKVWMNLPWREDAGCHRIAAPEDSTTGDITVEPEPT